MEDLEYQPYQSPQDIKEIKTIIEIIKNKQFEESSDKDEELQQYLTKHNQHLKHLYLATAANNTDKLQNNINQQQQQQPQQYQQDNYNCLQQLFRICKIKESQPGEVLYEKQQKVDFIYIILSGKISQWVPKQTSEFNMELELFNQYQKKLDEFNTCENDFEIQLVSKEVEKLEYKLKKFRIKEYDDIVRQNDPNKKYHNLPNIMNYKCIKTLTKSMFIGESECITNKLFNSTYITIEPTVLIQITSQQYLKIFDVQLQKLNFLEERLQKIMPRIAEDTLRQIIYKFEDEFFYQNQKIFSQGDHASKFYIIKNGNVKLTKNNNINEHLNHENQLDNHHILQKNKKGQLKPSTLQKKELEIMDLQSEGIFGLEDIFHKPQVRQLNAKAISIAFTHIYSISKAALEKIEAYTHDQFVTIDLKRYGRSKTQVLSNIVQKTNKFTKKLIKANDLQHTIIKEENNPQKNQINELETVYQPKDSLFNMESSQQEKSQVFQTKLKLPVNIEDDPVLKLKSLLKQEQHQKFFRPQNKNKSMIALQANSLSPLKVKRSSVVNSSTQQRFLKKLEQQNQSQNLITSFQEYDSSQQSSPMKLLRTESQNLQNISPLLQNIKTKRSDKRFQSMYIKTQNKLETQQSSDSFSMENSHKRQSVQIDSQQDQRQLTSPTRKNKKSINFNLPQNYENENISQTNIKLQEIQEGSIQLENSNRDFKKNQLLNQIQFQKQQPYINNDSIQEIENQLISNFGKNISPLKSRTYKQQSLYQQNYEPEQTNNSFDSQDSPIREQKNINNNNIKFQNNTNIYYNKPINLYTQNDLQINYSFSQLNNDNQDSNSHKHKKQQQKFFKTEEKKQQNMQDSSQSQSNSLSNQQNDMTQTQYKKIQQLIQESKVTLNENDHFQERMKAKNNLSKTILKKDEKTIQMRDEKELNRIKNNIEFSSENGKLLSRKIKEKQFLVGKKYVNQGYHDNFYLQKYKQQKLEKLKQQQQIQNNFEIDKQFINSKTEQDEYQYVVKSLTVVSNPPKQDNCEKNKNSIKYAEQFLIDPNQIQSNFKIQPNSTNSTPLNYQKFTNSIIKRNNAQSHHHNQSQDNNITPISQFTTNLQSNSGISPQKKFSNQNRYLFSSKGQSPQRNYTQNSNYSQQNLDDNNINNISLAQINNQNLVEPQIITKSISTWKQQQSPLNQQQKQNFSYVTSKQKYDNYQSNLKSQQDKQNKTCQNFTRSLKGSFSPLKKLKNTYYQDKRSHNTSKDVKLLEQQKKLLRNTNPKFKQIQKRQNIQQINQNNNQQNLNNN